MNSLPSGHLASTDHTPLAGSARLSADCQLFLPKYFYFFSSHSRFLFSSSPHTFSCTLLARSVLCLTATYPLRLLNPLLLSFTKLSNHQIALATMPPSNKWTADAERDLAMAIILSHGAIKHDWTAVYEKMSAWGYEFTTGSLS